MPRILFNVGQQRDFLSRAKTVSGNRLEVLAKICGVQPRTLRDWLREKYRMPQSAVSAIEDQLQIKAPQPKAILPDYWSVEKTGKAGGIARYKIYGSPATPEGRSKGGRRSCLVQQEALRRGVVTAFVGRKNIRLPAYDEQLAEAIGVILGDGSVKKFQVSIAVSALVDREYSKFLEQLFYQLFKTKVARKEDKKNTIRLTLSSRELVEWLVKMGLAVGDKIKQNIKIPDWIMDDENYLKACLRGLFDTDGCIYYHHHFVTGHEYNDIGWEFRSYNKNFLDAFNGFLFKNDFRAKKGCGRVDLYNRSDIKRYFKEIGTHNPKHWMRYSNYFNRQWRGAGAAELAALEMP